MYWDIYRILCTRSINETDIGIEKLYFIYVIKLFLEEDDGEYLNNDDDGSRFGKVAFEIASQLWLFHTCQTFPLNFMLLLNQDLASFLKCRKELRL